MGESEKTLKLRLERVAKLLEAARELHARQYDVLEEARKILHGEPAFGDKMRRASDTWMVAWMARYGSKYQWNAEAAKNVAALKRLLKGLDVADLESRMQRFLKDDDRYYVNARHPFALFATNINRYTAEHPAPLTLDAPPVSDCTHQPPCQTDQEHSRRRLEDRKAGR